MHYGIGRAWRCAIGVMIKVEMRGQRVEGLPAVGQIGDQRGYPRQIQRFEIEVQNVIAARLQIGHGVTPCLARAAGKNDALGHSRLRLVIKQSVYSFNSLGRTR